MMRAETCLSHDNYCKKWKVKVLVTQSCPILCDPMDCGLPDSSVHGILQTRILEGVAIPFSRGSSQPRGCTHVSCTAGRFFTVLATRESESEITQSCPTLCDPWTVAYQAPPSMGFFRQEYWSGLPFPSPGDAPNPGIKPGFPALEADALTSEPPGKPIATREAYCKEYTQNVHN